MATICDVCRATIPKEGQRKTFGFEHKSFYVEGVIDVSFAKKQPNGSTEPLKDVCLSCRIRAMNELCQYLVKVLESEEASHG